MANFFQISIVPFLTLIVTLISLISTHLRHKKHDQPIIKAKLLGFANFFNDRSYFSREKYDLLLKKFPDRYKTFDNDDDDLESYFTDNEVYPNRQGFWMDSIDDDLVILFQITSVTGNRTIYPISSIVQFKCENIQIQSLKIKDILVFRTQKLTDPEIYSNIRRVPETLEEYEACYDNQFFDSSLYLVLYEVFDKKNGIYNLCSHDMDKLPSEYRYNSIIFNLVITSINNKTFKRYIKVNKVGKDLKLETVKNGHWIQ